MRVHVAETLPSACTRSAGLLAGICSGKKSKSLLFPGDGAVVTDD